MITASQAQLGDFLLCSSLAGTWPGWRWGRGAVGEDGVVGGGRVGCGWGGGWWRPGLLLLPMPLLPALFIWGTLVPSLLGFQQDSQSPSSFSLGSVAVCHLGVWGREVCHLAGSEFGGPRLFLILRTLALNPEATDTLRAIWSLAWLPEAG